MKVLNKIMLHMTLRTTYVVTAGIRDTEPSKHGCNRTHLVLLLVSRNTRHRVRIHSIAYQFE